VSKMLSTKVSVLTPTFNRAWCLGRALESVLSQSWRNLEIIVIDDGSGDHTPEVCAKLAGVRYLRQPRNAGKTAAINLGLAHATGEFVWVMDDDDIAPPDALARLIAPMLDDADVGFSYGEMKQFIETADGEIIFAPATPPRPLDPRPLFVRLMEDCFITGQPCTLFRRSALDAIVPIDEAVKVSVDYNILLQVARRFRGAHVDAVVLWQRQHDGLRGPSAQRYRAHERAERWRDADARLLSRLLPSLEAAEFIGASANTSLSGEDRRRAYFQKAAIAGRKDLWQEASDAIRSARAAAPHAPLSSQERFILSQTLGSRYGIDSFLFSPAAQKALEEAAGSDRLGAEIRTAIAKRLTYWAGQYVRAGDVRRLMAALNALVALARAQAGELVLAALLGKAPFKNRLVVPRRPAGEPVHSSASAPDPAVLSPFAATAKQARAGALRPRLQPEPQAAAKR
jgi:hypothetical protein